VPCEVVERGLRGAAAEKWLANEWSGMSQDTVKEKGSAHAVLRNSSYAESCSLPCSIGRAQCEARTAARRGGLESSGGAVSAASLDKVECRAQARPGDLGGYDEIPIAWVRG
jgi:hypothetical protein